MSRLSVPDFPSQCWLYRKPRFGTDKDVVES